MYKKSNATKRCNRNENDEQCYCIDNNRSYKIIENYRSILDRKQQSISSWKVFDQNGKVSFIRGTKYRKNTDALVIRSNHICLINPWYKYLDVTKYLPSIFEQNRCDKVLEIVLLECNCLTNSLEYELAIIECPCLVQTRSYCTYCRLTLAATEQSSRMLKNVEQQTDISFSLEFFNDRKNINDSIYSQSGPYKHQRTVQIQVESEQVLCAINEYKINATTTKKSTSLLQPSLLSQTWDDDADHYSSETKSITLLHTNDMEQDSSQSEDVLKWNEDLFFNENTFEELAKYISRETQTKLVAIFLPQSPLSDMKPSKIEARTSMNVTRTCQVNTLSYLIKTNENQTDVHPSSTSFLHTETRLMKELPSEHKDFSIQSLREMQHQTLTDCEYDEQGVTVPIIQFEGDELPAEEIFSIEERSKEFILTSSPLKCVNACNTIDFDNGTISTRISSDRQDKKNGQSIDAINLEHVDVQHKKYSKPFDSSHTQTMNNSNKNNNSEHLSTIDCRTSKLFRLKTTHYRFISRKRRRYRNKKRIYAFLQRLHRRKKSNIIPLFSSKQHSPSPSYLDRNEYHFPPTQSNSIQHKISLNQQQPSVINLHLNNSDDTPQYRLSDHTVIARASKNSSACKQLQTLMKNPDADLDQLIDSQLMLTCNNNCKSVCILMDDQKQSEHHRTSFLEYIYTTLSNTLKRIIHDQSIQFTCMNLAFFNNSLCDIIHMQRLRLVDTGRKIFLLPSCDVSVKTSDDIDTAINRLSTKMTFAHQIFIINFHHNCSSLSGSFFFLQLAPICSIRPTGLLTNLNSTTYSVLNLIRQLNNGQLFHHNTAKRYLFNDCSLNRLLKSYLFSPQQTMSVITVKQQQKNKL